MKFLPIVGRELRVASRRSETWWIRTGSALVGLCLAGWVLLATLQDPASRAGSILFNALSVFAFIYAFLAGMRITADCLSEEKREGTLGLLFLTDLKGYDVVLGKLAATSMHAVYGLLAFFPILAMSLLLGGISLGQFGRTSLVCLNTLFFSLACGIFASSISRDERKAMGATLGILLFFTAGIPLLGVLGDEWLDWPGYYQFLFLIPSPVTSFYMGFFPLGPTLNSFPAASAFWVSTISVHLLGWLLVVLASWIVPRTWQDRGLVKAEKGFRHRIEQWCYGTELQRLIFRRQLLEPNPIVWLTSRNRVKTSLVWFFLITSGALWFWAYLENGDDWLFEGTYIFTAVSIHTVLKLWVVCEVCRRFNEDRNSGALELLLSTPLSISEILKGQLFSIFRQFGRPVGVVLLADFIMMIAGATENQGDERVMYIAVFLVGMAVFVVDLLALSWVGMSMAMRCRRMSQATSGAFVRILLLPWVVFGTIMVTMVILDEVLKVRFFRSQGNIGELGVLFFWFGSSLFFCALFGFRAFFRLHREFRFLAMERYAQRRRFPWPWRKRTPNS